jgi:hypothetical protein
MTKKFVAETVNTFSEIHIVEAENKEEAQFIVQHSDYNASKWLGQQVANVSKFDERDLPRLKQVDTYFFEGYATIEDDYLLYRKMDGSLNGNMPPNKVR